ncbi:hypothetical protein YQE_09220, partial [Dendroctonus ponderosae]
MINRGLLSPQKVIQASHEAFRGHSRAMSTIPTQSRVVIAGAGVVANSVAYHLVQSGWNDVTVVEQRKIGSGTSHFGSGTLGLFKPISHRNVIWQV